MDMVERSSLLEDLIVIVMHLLAIPDLFHAETICTSWRAAYSAVRRFRFPITDASPCLLYSSAGDDAGTATIYSPSANAAFKVRLPCPSFRSLYAVGSAHGWIVVAAEQSNLRAINPHTGAQVDLPPVTALDLDHVEASSDGQGRHVYNLLDKLKRSEPPGV